MTAPEPAALDLLLCDADERAPVLPGGLPESALAAAPAPERGPRGKDSLHLEDLAADPNDLAAQRWAVIAPEGPAGDQALAAIAALIEHRRAQQGADPIVYRVADGMDAAAALRWKNEVLRAEDVAADERPRYLMILGDIDRVSLELQHVLANGSFVGRLCCASAKGYRSYAEKVVASERGAAATRARALYYTVQDGSSAIAAGHRHLVLPSLRMTADLAARGKLAVDGPTEVPHSEWGPDELFAVAGVDAPSLLVSLSHGLGAPRRGWKSPDQQRAMQGALSLGSGDPLTADMVRESRFLPGGVWMCVACYGAGTPPHSAFHPWLALLAEHGGGPESAAAVLRALPRPGERPFVAALPQALLANPAGPVAVVGHMDLAWTFGFTDPTGKHSRASRLHAAQRALAGGSRAGVGLDALMHAYREVNDELMAGYQTQRDALARGQRDPVDPRRLGDAWMQRNDLRGYVLLGDPAARLPVTAGARVAQAEAAELQDRPRPPRAPIELDTRAPPPGEIATPADPPITTAAPTPMSAPCDPPITAVAAPTPMSAPASGEISTPGDPPIVTSAAPTPMSAPEPGKISTPGDPPIVTSAAPTPMSAPEPGKILTPGDLSMGAGGAAQEMSVSSTAIQPPRIRAAAPGEPSNPALATAATPGEPSPPAPGLRAVPAPVAAPRAPAGTAPATIVPAAPILSPAVTASPAPAAPFSPPAPSSSPEVPMNTAPPESPSTYPQQSQPGAAPLGAMVRPRTLENPEIGLRERAVLAMLRGDEAPRGIAVRFGLPLEEIFYWLDVYREAGRRALGG